MDMNPATLVSFPWDALCHVRSMIFAAVGCEISSRSHASGEVGLSDSVPEQHLDFDGVAATHDAALQPVSRCGYSDSQLSGIHFYTAGSTNVLEDVGIVDVQTTSKEIKELYMFNRNIRTLSNWDRKSKMLGFALLKCPESQRIAGAGCLQEQSWPSLTLSELPTRSHLMMTP